MEEIVVGNRRFKLSSFRDSIEKIMGIQTCFRIVLQLKNNKDQITIVIESPDEDIKKHAFKAMELKREIYTNLKELKNLYRNKLINDIIVEMIPPASSVNEQNGNHRREIIDNRSKIEGEQAGEMEME